MKREKYRHKRKANKLKIAVISLLSILIVLVGIAIFFITPIGTKVSRNIMPERDAPMDLIAKKVILSKMNGTSDEEQAITKLFSDYSVNEVIEIASSEEKAVETMKDKFGISDDDANIIGDAIFKDDSITPLRDAVKNGSWVEASKEANKLISSGYINKLKEEIGEQKEISVQTLQDEASNILNGNQGEE